MSRKLTSSRTARWIGVASVVFSVATAALVLRGDEDEVNPIGILFRRRDQKAEKQKEDKPPGSQLPADVPKAPPVQNPQAIKGPPIDDPVLKRVDDAIRLNKKRFLTAEPINGGKPNSPWQIMHAALALRNDLEVRTNRGIVNGIEWISRDPIWRGDHWFEATRFGGRGHPFTTPYHFEGHVNQFLALLTMSNLPLDHKIGVANGRYVTMADMVKHAQMTTNSNEELSWTLWFLTHYLEPDAVWTNANGERWGMEKLINIQTADEVTTAPCGGTHGLFALSYARNSYLQKFGKLQGNWLAADQKIQRYIKAAEVMQNRDGSFSAKFFRENDYTDDPTDRLKTSGHMLEWLMMAVPQQKLSEDWMRRGVYRVADDLVRFSNQEIDPGPLYHALHSIVLYRERVMPRSAAPAQPQQPSLADRKTPAPPTPIVATPPTPNNAGPSGAAPSTGGPGSTVRPLTPTPPAPTIDPKSVAGSPKNPPPPRPVQPLPVIPLKPEPEKPLASTEPEKKTAELPPSTTPPPAVAPLRPEVAQNARPIPMGPGEPLATNIPQPDVKPIAPAPVQPKAASSTDTPVVTLPTLPTLSDVPLPGARTPGPAVPKNAPVGTAAVPPNPTPPADTKPEVKIATDAPKNEYPTPPFMTLQKRSHAGESKPDSATGPAPKGTTVQSATPIILPPLPLDPVDQPTAAGK